MAHDFSRFLAILRHDLVRDHVLDTRPAWVFSQSGQEILWSNMAGLAFLDVRNLDALARYRGEKSSPITRRLADLATHKQMQQGGLERLRFFVGVRSKSAACLCQIIAVPGGEHGVFAIAIDASPSRGDAKPGPGLVRLFEAAEIPAALMDDSGAVAASTRAFESVNASLAGETPIFERLDDPRLISIQSDNGADTLFIWDDAATSDLPQGEVPDEPGAADTGTTREPDQDRVEPYSQAGTLPEDDSGSTLDPAIAGVFAAAGAALAAQAPETEGLIRETPVSADPTAAGEIPAAEEAADATDRLKESLLEEPAENEEEDGSIGPAPDPLLQDNIQADLAPDTLDADDEESSPGSLSDAISRLAVPLMEIDDDGPRRLAPEEPGDALSDQEETEATPVTPPTEPAGSPALAGTDFEFTARRAPHRFVWEMDGDRRFSSVTPDLGDAVGPNAADIVGKTWQEISSALNIENPALASKIAAGETWTGMRVDWPVEASDQMAPVELTALPIYDRNRKFAGYRGFGVCRTDSAKTDPQARGLRFLKTEPAAMGLKIPESKAPPIVEADSHVPSEQDALKDESPAKPDLATGDILGLFVEARTPDSERAGFSLMAENAAQPDIDTGAEASKQAGREPATKTDTSEPSGQTSVQESGTGAPLSDSRQTTDNEPSGPVFAEKVSDMPRTESKSALEPGGRSNVVPMIPVTGSESDEKLKRLSRPEREAFQQIAQALGARLEGEEDNASEMPGVPGRPTIEVVEPDTPVIPLPSAFAIGRRDIPEGILLDRLPTGVLLCRGADVLFANRAALDLLEYQSSQELRHAGGLEAIFAEESTDPAAYGSQDVDREQDKNGLKETGRPEDTDRPITIRTKAGTMKALFARLYSVPWANDRALMIVFEQKLRDDPMADLHPGADRIEELESILDTATDGVLVLEADGTIQAANRSAEALFAADRADMIGASLTDYLAPESYRAAVDYLDGLARNGVESVLNDGREVIGMESSGGLIPMFMTIGRINKSGRSAKFCAVLRDITQWKKAEEELTSARRQAETASSQKSDFLAKISHEIRTPLNAIIGFSEVMLGERLGPIGTERYKEYLNDIRGSGDYIMSLVNDLLDLSKIEAGKMDLTFEAVSVNDILHNCVSLLQPEANRERIIIRTSLSESVPNVVADARSFQQIVLNLLSNAIKFNKRGGQVIVSSVYSEDGSVCVRVRDTGIGMTDEGLSLALEPFRQLQTTRSSAGGTGLGLPLTKALVEANRAKFMIDSKPQQGTMVEIIFPSPRVLAE